MVDGFQREGVGGEAREQRGRAVECLGGHVSGDDVGGRGRREQQRSEAVGEPDEALVGQGAVGPGGWMVGTRPATTLVRSSNWGVLVGIWGKEGG